MYNDAMRAIARHLGFLIFFLLFASATSYAASDQPIQHNGRIKPFDSFARSTLKFISGRESWDKKNADRVLMEAAAAPGKVAEWKWIRIDLPELKATLGLSPENNFFSYKDLIPAGPRILSLAKSSQAKRQADARPSKLEQKAVLLQAQISTIEAITSGDIFRVVPSAEGHEWQPGGDPGNWPKNIYAVNSWQFQKMRLESLYFKIMPFQWSALLYFVAFILLIFFRKWEAPKPMGIVFMGMAVMFHTTGLLARCLILSRPPVSNMFESMIFMNWALIVFALIFAVIYGNVAVLAAGSFVSGFVMLYAHLLPIDSGLDVLVPVLRSNYWLSIHVMTIVSSYGAFGLAMSLGHWYLLRKMFNTFENVVQEENAANLIFRVIQLGTILIGTGTVLGGVWANESWGRFWGWDPKETWALITFLGYLIVIHLRFLNKISHTALALCSVLGFGLVLMTWYGVNFVLGRGLHSYGQGSGGMEWIIYYLVLEAAFLVFMIVKSRKVSR